MTKSIYGFWISPNAEVHTILTDFGHKEIIENILGRAITKDEEEKALFDDGWIRIVNMEKTLMVNYRCICCSKQIEAIKKIEEQLTKDGYFHEQYILDYGYDYHFFDSIRSLTKRIKERLI
jgi:hypothetical protein